MTVGLIIAVILIGFILPTAGILILLKCYICNDQYLEGQQNKINGRKNKLFDLSNITKKDSPEPLSKLSDLRSEICPICLKTKCDVYLECSHYFHGDCIVEWLNIHSECPVCRKRILSSESIIQPKNKKLNLRKIFSQEK